MPLSAAAFTFGLLLLVPSGWAVATEKHSGTIVAIDRTHITIDEMGPWQGPATQPIRRTFRLTDSTRIMEAQRTKEGINGWAWAFDDKPATSDPHPGDFVTLTIEPEGARMVATEVLVVWPGVHLEIPGSS